MDILKNTYIYLVGDLEHEFYFSIQLGMSSSQLTFTPSFLEGFKLQTISELYIIYLYL